MFGTPLLRFEPCCWRSPATLKDLLDAKQIRSHQPLASHGGPVTNGDWKRLLPVVSQVEFVCSQRPAVALGLSRFAYALLLPAMRADLHWSFAIAGAMNTANALGYLGGAFVTITITRRWGTRRCFIATLGGGVLVLLATASTGNTVVLVALRALSGALGAVTFVTGAGLVAFAISTLSSERVATLLGIYFAGAGIGIVASGLVIPRLLSATSLAQGWRWGWVLLAGLGLVALMIGVPVALASGEPPSPPFVERHWPARRFRRLLASYGLFGTGYIAYMTFIVAYLKGHGTESRQITVFWVVLGASSMVGALLWGRPIARLRGGRGPSLILAVVSVGASLPLISTSRVATLSSAVCFGGSFLSVVTSVTSVTRRSLQAHHWTAAIAGLTAAFALGQCLGPVLAGVLSDGPAGLRLGLELSLGVLLAATLSSFTHEDYGITAHA